MKKFYLLMMLFMASTVMGQTPIITMIMDGDCSGGNPKVVELYAQGTVDFSNFSLEKSPNGGAWGSAFDLSLLGTVTDEFVYIYKDDPSFATEFPNAVNTLATTSDAVNFNGDDAIRLIITGAGTVVDQYGADNTDGTGEPWEYKDGYAKRIDNTTPSGAWVEADWDFYNGSLDGNGLCQGGTDSYETLTGAGSYSDVPVTVATVNSSVSTISGFTQILGTPSAEETVDVSGLNLTNDIVITVNSGDYEISATSGTGFGTSVTLPFGTGTVSATPIYVRLNGAAVANPSNGELIITSAGAANDTVTLEGEVVEFTVSTVADVTGVDADGVGTSIGEYVTLTGVLHCQDFRGGDGYDITLIDNNNDGINVFNFDDVNGLTLNEGDEVSVNGYIDQYNGLLQIRPIEINVLLSGATLQTPTIVTTLDESTESQLVKLENLTLVNGETTWPNQGNIDVTDGTTTFLVRVPGSSPIADSPTPTGTFSIIGIGKQFDNSLPYTEGYQIFPCSIGGNVGLSTDEFAGISVYPNPVTDVLNISNENGLVESVEVLSTTGSVVYTSAVSSNNFTVNTAGLNAGIYFVNVHTANGVKTFKVVK